MIISGTLEQALSFAREQAAALRDPVLHHMEEPGLHQVVRHNDQPGFYELLRSEATTIVMPDGSTHQGRPAVRFFHENAGGSQGPDETPAAAKMRCALDMAAAEKRAEELDLKIWWDQDEDPLAFEHDEDPAEEYLWCGIFAPGGWIERDDRPMRGKSALASLCGIGFNISTPEDRLHKKAYMRVVEAELCLEALAQAPYDETPSSWMAL